MQQQQKVGDVWCQEEWVENDKPRETLFAKCIDSPCLIHCWHCWWDVCANISRLFMTSKHTQSKAALLYSPHGQPTLAMMKLADICGEIERLSSLHSQMKKKI